MNHIKKWDNLNEARMKDYEISENFQQVSEAFEMADEGLSLVLDFLNKLKRIKGIDKYSTDVKKLYESCSEIRQKFETEFDSRYEL